MTTSSLAAILFTELAGFGDFLAAHEDEALGILRRWRDLAGPLIEGRGGDLVDATGDELLVVFPSAVAAVQCAVDLKEALPLGLASSTGGAFRPRTGLHLGEIWREGGRIFGNGVNVAARIKAEAGPGQILVSEDLGRQVATKLPYALDALPDRPLKNIERTLALFEVGREGPPPTGSARAAPSGAPNPRFGLAPGGAGAVATEPHPGPLPPAPPLPPEPLVAPSFDPGAEARRRALKESILRNLGEEALSRLSYNTEGRSLVLDLSGLAEEEDARAEGTSAVEAARSKAGKGLRSLVVGGAILGACLWYYLRSPTFLWAVGAFLFGLGPALSGLKNLVMGLFELRDLHHDGRRP